MDLETGTGKVLPVYIEEEMQKSYIDYAMSVIVQRALPDRIILKCFGKLLWALNNLKDPI